MDIMDTQYYVYELIDPRTDEVFYVGKGNGDRMYRHKKQAFQNKGSKINPHKSARIRQIVNEGHELKYRKILCGDESDAFAKERELIALYGKRCDGTGCLTNLTDGGDGFSGGHIPICQYDLFGTFIKQHRSAKDAAVAVGANHSSRITTACRGGHRGEVSAYGFLWSYVGEDPPVYEKRRPVYQWTLDGKFIQKYSNATVAAAAVGCDPSNIPVAIKRNNVSGGYIWSHDETFPGVTKSRRLRRVKHINTGIVYESATAAARATEHTVQSVCSVCGGKKPHVGGDEFCYDDSVQC